MRPLRRQALNDPHADQAVEAHDEVCGFENAQLVRRDALKVNAEDDGNSDSPSKGCAIRRLGPWRRRDLALLHLGGAPNGFVFAFQNAQLPLVVGGERHGDQGRPEQDDADTGGGLVNLALLILLAGHDRHFALYVQQFFAQLLAGQISVIGGGRIDGPNISGRLSASGKPKCDE